jgi:hypothetical protein
MKSWKLQHQIEQNNYLGLQTTEPCLIDHHESMMNQKLDLQKSMSNKNITTTLSQKQMRSWYFSIKGLNDEAILLNKAVNNFLEENVTLAYCPLTWEIYNANQDVENMLNDTYQIKQYLNDGLNEIRTYDRSLSFYSYIASMFDEDMAKSIKEILVTAQWWLIREKYICEDQINTVENGLKRDHPYFSYTMKDWMARLEFEQYVLRGMMLFKSRMIGVKNGIGFSHYYVQSVKMAMKQLERYMDYFDTNFSAFEIHGKVFNELYGSSNDTTIRKHHATLKNTIIQWIVNEKNTIENNWHYWAEDMHPRPLEVLKSYEGDKTQYLAYFSILWRKGARFLYEHIKVLEMKKVSLKEDNDVQELEKFLATQRQPGSDYDKMYKEFVEARRP